MRGENEWSLGQRQSLRLVTEMWMGVVVGGGNVRVPWCVVCGRRVASGGGVVFRILEQ